MRNIKASLSRVSLSRTASGSHDPLPDPRGIYEAQPSPYWTGRFTTLSDQHLSTATSTLSLSLSPLSPTHHPPLTTRDPTSRPLSRVFSASELKRVDSALDETDRARAVFAELEGLCRTERARRSLFEWREGWAAKRGCPGVLPRGQRILGKLGFGRE